MAKGSEGIKGHEHAAAHAHGHGHAHSTHDDGFAAQVRSLKDAEGAAAQKVEDAKKEAARVEAAARESAVEMMSKSSQKAVEAKNEIIAKKRGETESEIASIMAAAKKQANSIRAKRLSETDVAEISQDI